NVTADAVVRDPAKERRVDAALQNEILDETTYRVVGKSRRDGCTETKAATKTAGDVVFAATFPNREVARGVDTAFAGVEAEHDFAGAGAGPGAIRLGNQ